MVDNYYTNLKLYVRKDTNVSHPKVEIINIDFNNLENYSDLITGDDCYFCIGTTKKETPTKDAYRKIEYDIPVGIAAIAKKNNINSFIYVSSLGSSPTTKNTYLRNKGHHLYYWVLEIPLGLESLFYKKYLKVCLFYSEVH